MTRKVERKFAVRNVTELMVDDGQQADRGRKTRLNDVNGLVRGVKSAGRIERLLRNKRGFRERWNQKCSFPTLSEQESSETTQMDRGEIEVEEERRVRIKRMPVFPTDREKHENESAHVANRGQCQKIPANIWRTRWTVDSLLMYGRGLGHEHSDDTEAS